MEESTIIEIQQADASTKNENQNTEIQNEQLENFIREKFGNLEPLATKCRINKVPYHIRKWKNEAYTPHVISIGPIHHDKKKFQTTEKYKVRYFKSFMQQVIKHNGIKLEDLVSTIKKMEDRIRHCYVETVKLESDAFVNMIMLDACFILELILRENWGINDPIRMELILRENWEMDYRIRMEGWVKPMVRRDLFLLENQLPFFVIENLYHLALPSLSNSTPLIQLTFYCFKDLNIHNKCPPNEEIKHFTDLLRYFQLPPPNELPDRDHEAQFPKYSVTQLHEAGVEFKVGEEFKVASRKCIRVEKPSSKCILQDEEASTKCLLDKEASSVCVDDPSRRILDLSFENRVLKIRQLVFDDSTEAHVRNIMALEQCDYKSKAYVTDFYSILDNLINTDKDVELLINEGILVNDLGENKAVASMMNSLNRGIFYNNMIPKFRHLSDDLNDHYEKRCHRWMAMLKQQYFCNPWRSTATVAATILLVLTLIIAVTSILLVVP